MAVNVMNPKFSVGVVGAGAMGRGIAQVAATGGITVLLTDDSAEVAEQARAFIQDMLERAVAKGRMGREEAEAAIARVTTVNETGALRDCDLVVEAVVENLSVKQAVFRTLEEHVSPECILASNTSSLSITSIASQCRDPGRVAGFHFFNPVPLMKLVEVIDGERTEPWVGEALMQIGERMGRSPVRVKDAPGFLVNQIGRGFTIEAAHIAEEGIAGFEDIDRIMRDTAAFRMGPFELMELTGLDVTHPATEAIYDQFYHEPRFRPSLLMRSRTEAGVLGRKTAKGFYDYQDGKLISSAEPPVPDAWPKAVWISTVEADAHKALTGILRDTGVALESTAQPSDHALCLVTPVGEDATTAALDQQLDPARTVAVETLFSPEKRRVIMPTPVTERKHADAAHALLATGGIPVTVLRDSPGFVAQRIVAMIVNISCAIAQARAASPEDIDKAPTLALNYPHGPLSYGDTLGPQKVLRILNAMHRLYGDPRYRPSLWLTRRARLGVSLLTPER